MKKADKILKEFGLNQPEVIYDFFVGFSFFEYRLLTSGFVADERPRAAWWPGGSEWIIAEVGWSEFATQAKRQASSEVGRICARHLEFMKVNPPSVPIRHKKSGRIDWGYPANEAKSIVDVEKGYELGGPYNLERLSVLLRRIRNNLFHGSKFRDRFDVTLERISVAREILNDFDRLLTMII